MGKYIVSFYPVRPYESFVINNLENLKDDEWADYNDYMAGKERNGLTKFGIAHYNNRSLMMIDANSIREAINIFWTRMEDEANEHRHQTRTE